MKLRTYEIVFCQPPQLRLLIQAENADEADAAFGFLVSQDKVLDRARSYEEDLYEVLTVEEVDDEIDWTREELVALGADYLEDE